MKKSSIIIAVITFCFIFMLCGCNTDKTAVTNNSSQSENIQQTTSDNSSSQTSQEINDLVSAFKPPAEVFDINLSKDDPSNDDIRFEYDDKGRISQCYYKVNDIDVYQGYIYKDNAVQIYSYSGSIVVGDALFENAVYDGNKGFSEHNGYYFKNVIIK